MFSVVKLFQHRLSYNDFIVRTHLTKKKKKNSVLSIVFSHTNQASFIDLININIPIILFQNIFPVDLYDYWYR